MSWLGPVGAAPVLALALALAGCAHLPSTPLIEEQTAILADDPENGPALTDRAFAYAMLGERRAAERGFKAALAAGYSPGYVYWSYGWALFNLGAYDEALAKWEKGFESGERPTPWWRHHAFAIAHWRAGRKEEALRSFNEAATRYPKQFGTWDALVAYTAFWTWKEKEAIYEVFSAWDRAWDSGGRPNAPAGDDE